jgi:cyclopropane-fatty-acyl-phospholipid synthase
MSLASMMIAAAEHLPIPHLVVRNAINQFCARISALLAADGRETDADFAAKMAHRYVAEHVDAANAQHYELPAAFFGHVLGPSRKYSCCYYERMDCTLQDAETEALRQTIEHADLRDGQSILELGCGWGALSLKMARQFPHSRVIAVSNSNSQRIYIESEAAKANVKNLRMMTGDINSLSLTMKFDRVVSVEMFEHMMNWGELLTRIRSWMTPDGSLFLHIFNHRSTCYLFDRNDRDDWIAQHFFTGGVMPSRDLIRQYKDLFSIENDWRWSGSHYQRTALDWLDNFKRNRVAIERVLQDVYGRDTDLWLRRWQWFFLAVAGLFGFAEGTEWGVSHFRLKPIH